MQPTVCHCGVKGSSKSARKTKLCHGRAIEYVCDMCVHCVLLERCFGLYTKTVNTTPHYVKAQQSTDIGGPIRVNRYDAITHAIWPSDARPHEGHQSCGQARTHSHALWTYLLYAIAGSHYVISLKSLTCAVRLLAQVHMLPYSWAIGWYSCCCQIHRGHSKCAFLKPPKINYLIPWHV